MFITHTQYLKMKFISRAALFYLALLENLYQEGVKLLHPAIADDYLADMIFSGVSLDMTIERMNATVEVEAEDETR